MDKSKVIPLIQSKICTRRKNSEPPEKSRNAGRWDSREKGLKMRVTILVEVNTDQVPGWGYDPQDFANHIDHYLKRTIPHYNPVVTLKPTTVTTTSITTFYVCAPFLTMENARSAQKKIRYITRIINTDDCPQMYEAYETAKDTASYLVIPDRVAY